MELAKAYVQIIPTTKGIGKGIEAGINGSGAAESSGASFGGKLSSAIKKVIATAAIGKTLKAFIMAGADLQQSVGGIETLFKGSADTMVKYANNAYKTTGLSANAYMEQVTSFSASLLQSLGGDTEKAAKSANSAMVDMADNANKFGTDMQSIQNAYQGFAKQNYTMLDNLKLGYGGTKEEMQRLLADATKLSGVKYDLNNLDDVYRAIHVIQENLGVTGTTAKEAATTFSVSFASMKASATNLLATMSLGNQATMTVGESVKSMVGTTKTFLIGNLIPMVGNIAKSLPKLFSSFVMEVGTEIRNGIPGFSAKAYEIITAFRQGLADNLPAMLEDGEQIVGNIINGVTTYLPMLAAKGAEFIPNILNGTLEKIPLLLVHGGNIAKQLINGIGVAFPSLVDSGGNMLVKVINGIVANLPKIVVTGGKVIMQLVATFAQNLPQLLQSGIEMIGKVAAGLVKGIPDLIGKVPEIYRAAKNAFESVDWLSIGKNIVKGIAKGLTSAAGEIVKAAKEAANDALKAAKKVLGIESPSKVFEVEVGQMIPRGMAKGIVKKTGIVKDATSTLRDISLSPFDNVGMKSYEIEPKANREENDEIVRLIRIILMILENIEKKDTNLVINQRVATRAMREWGVVFN